MIMDDMKCHAYDCHAKACVTPECYRLRQVQRHLRRRDQGSQLDHLQGQDREHRLLTGVYYILALRNSIINIGQLDENGSWVEIEDGVLRI
jgi:hypothetical protein